MPWCMLDCRVSDYSKSNTITTPAGQSDVTAGNTTIGFNVSTADQTTTGIYDDEFLLMK